LKLAAGMFLNTGDTDGLIEPYRNESGLGIPFIADISVSGGYDAGFKLATRATNKLGIVEPTYILAAGLPVDGVKDFQRHLAKEKTDASIMTTGALPENNPHSFKVEFNREPLEYTEMKVTQAKNLGIVGVYAAAKYGTPEARLGLCAGVSLSGKPYKSDGYPKDATAIEKALEVSDQILLGSVLENASSVVGYLKEVIAIVDGQLQN